MGGPTSPRRRALHEPSDTAAGGKKQHASNGLDASPKGSGGAAGGSVKVSGGGAGAAAAAACHSPGGKASVGVLQLACITFFAVAGGAYGFEDTVGAAGGKVVLIGLLVVPILWSIPLALLTAELSSMIPEAGGHIVWVHKALGGYWVGPGTYSSSSNSFFPLVYLLSYVASYDVASSIRQALPLGLSERRLELLHQRARQRAVPGRTRQTLLATS